MNGPELDAQIRRGAAALRQGRRRLTRGRREHEGEAPRSSRGGRSGDPGHDPPVYGHDHPRLGDSGIVLLAMDSAGQVRLDHERPLGHARRVEPVALDAVDLDGDGWDELVAGFMAGGRSSLVVANGQTLGKMDGRLWDFSLGQMAPEPQTDMAFATTGSGAWVVLDGKTQKLPAEVPGQRILGLTFADLDGGGDELVVVRSSGVTVLRRDPTSGDAVPVSTLPLRGVTSLSVFEDRAHPQRKAVEECPPGAVFVIDSRKDARAASAGSILVARLMQRGVAGVVTDGGFRDSPEIASLGFPSTVWSRRPISMGSPSIQPAKEGDANKLLRFIASSTRCFCG